MKIAEITLKLLALFYSQVGKNELKYNNVETVGDVIDQFLEEYSDSLEKTLFDPKTKTLQQYILILLNGRNIHFLNGRDTILTDGDVVAISPPIAGGS